MSKGLFSQRVGLRLMAVLLALILWAYVHTERQETVTEVTRTFENVKLDWRVPADYVLTHISSETVAVTVRGPERLVAEMSSDGLLAHLELEPLGKGSHQVPVTVDLPGNMQLVEINPNPIEIILEPWQERLFPVSFELQDALPAGRTLHNVVMEPQVVIVAGAETAVDRVARVVALYNYAQAGHSQEDVKLEARDRNDSPVTAVNIYGAVNIELEIWQNKEVPLQLNAEESLAGQVTLEPATAVITGPDTLVAEISAIEVALGEPEVLLEKGSVQLPITVPPGIRLVQPEDSVVTVTLNTQP